MKDFEIEFYKNKEQDKQDTYEFFEGEDPAGNLNRAIGCGMPLFLANDIAKNTENSKQNLYNHMDKEYSVIEQHNLYVNSQANAIKFWSDISKEFSEIVKNITSKPLDDYKCLLTLYITTAAWNDEIIIRRNIKELSQDRFLIAFEILLSHSFKCLREFYSEEEIASQWNVWAFAEITASFMLRDDKISELFPELNFPLEKNWFAGTNYQFLAKYEDVLKIYWIEKKSFKEYIENAVKYLSKNEVEFK